MLLGEDEDVAFYGTRNDELHLAFNFPLMGTTRLTPAHVRANQTARLTQLSPDAWPCSILGNHDSPRIWSRYGDGEHDAPLARLHLSLLLTLKGTPFLFNGEEIGMAYLDLARSDQLRDTTAIQQYPTMTGRPAAEAQRAVFASTRDRCRSPFQWSDEPDVGFCLDGVTPWLLVHRNYARGVNVDAQAADPASLLNF